jgi:hypothetical protein
MSVLYVTNLASRKHHGPGKRYTIMAAPRSFEHGDGCVNDLAPMPADVRAVKDGYLSLRAYRDKYIELAGQMPLWPEGLVATPTDAEDRDSGDEVSVAHGDTLFCSCAVDAAREGRCHRVWAAELLRRAGWAVILDGCRLTGVTADWKPVLEEPKGSLL